jgi:hypothetical protein
MQKLRLNERQILMLQKLQEKSPKTKVLKINEDQYSRLFSGGSNANEKLSKSIKKAGLDEDIENVNPKLDLLEFAQELIVFIKDMLSRPDNAPFSKYWLEMGITKDKLVSMLEKEGLLSMNLGEDDGAKTYVTEKLGFRKKIKEFYNTINELGDAGYPAGAENDPNNPWDSLDPEPDETEEAIKSQKEILKFEYFNADMDGLTLFSRGNELFAILLTDITEDELEPYEEKKGWPSGETVYHYVNDKLAHGEIKIYSNNAPHGQIALVTPKVKQELLKWFGIDKELVGILNQIPESTGAASSGAFVGGMSNGPINRGLSPDKALQDLSEVIDPSGVVQFYKQKPGESRFIIDDITWEHCWAKDENGKTINGVYRYGQDITYSLEWFNNNILKNLSEMDSATAGGESGTFAFDVPAGDGSAFWNAGNKENKGEADKPQGMPIVRGGKMNEGLKVGQVYKNGGGRRKINKVNKLTGAINVRQWGDQEGARDMNITRKQFGGWDLIHENKKKVLKITEDQLKRVLESDNQTSTAYPNGEMVNFDDCTKLNNNKVAQNGGCSQGDDGVVKLSKTKNSVVAEGFNPTIGAGSVYAVELSTNGAKFILTQDNGQTVVIHHDDIPDLIKALKSAY